MPRRWRCAAAWRRATSDGRRRPPPTMCLRIENNSPRFARSMTLRRMSPWRHPDIPRPHTDTFIRGLARARSPYARIERFVEKPDEARARAFTKMVISELGNAFSALMSC
jgi:hypothetical protein